MFPLTFISSAFVPVESMPGPIQWFAEINRSRSSVDALRALWLGAPAGSAVWAAVVWSLVILAVFAPPGRATLPARGGEVGAGPKGTWSSI